LKRGEIELAVADRKRQQAVADTAEKKDQELKVQKTLSKALSEKVGKLQEEVKTLRTQTPEIRHPRKVLRNCNRTTEEELSFELTPEKK
jgi:phage shock protein A